jgi:small multidrug resistance pump
MAWILLSIAILAEIAGTLFLKASDGLSKLWPSLGVLVGYATAFTLMATSLKKLDVGVTYAIWSGVGIIGAAVGGYFSSNNRSIKSRFLAWSSLLLAW